MFNSSVGGRFQFIFFKKNLEKIEKKNNLLISFSTVTVYRLDHTYSLGSVEPTIALSKSLWSRIVTLIKKIEKEKKIASVVYLFGCFHFLR